MNYKKFLEEIKRKIKEYLGEETKIEEKSVLKNNGIRKSGIVILEEGQNCAPTIYLDEYFEQYNDGRCVYDIAYEIVKYYEEHKIEVKVHLEGFYDFSVIKDKICFRLIHGQKNAELLKTIPHIPYLDLEMVFYIAFEHESIGSGSILLRNEHLKKWEVDVNTVRECAFINTQKLLKGEIKPMEDVIYAMMKEKMIMEIENSIKLHTASGMTVTDEMVEPILKEMMGTIYSEPKGPKMYVASNDSRNFGSAVVLYNGFLENFSKKTNADYYILPSSVHEVILIPTDQVDDVAHLKHMVCDVNSQELLPEDVLSESVYLYLRSAGHITKIG